MPHLRVRVPAQGTSSHKDTSIEGDDGGVLGHAGNFGKLLESAVLEYLRGDDQDEELIN